MTTFHHKAYTNLCILQLFFDYTETVDPELVSSIDIQDILDVFNWSHLNSVYIHLGLENKDIQNERLATHQPSEQVRKILHFWCKTKAGGATKEVMIAAMDKVPECRASLNKLKEKWNNRSTGKHDIMVVIEVWGADILINPITCC